MLHLQLLGGLGLACDSGDLPLGAIQRRRLAFLAVLALAGERGLTRERLGGLLWPESSSERARHALEQLLYASRRDLGRDALLTYGTVVRLNPEVVATDLAAFDAAVAAGQAQRAAELYAGPLLDGVYLDGAAELEQWVDAERARRADAYAAALEDAARARAVEGDAFGAVEAWRRRASQDPFSARGTLGLMRALDAAGDRAAAIRQADVHATLLREELGAEPDREVVALAERLRAPAPVQAAPVQAPPSPPLTDPAPQFQPPDPGEVVSAVAPAGVSAPHHLRFLRPPAALGVALLLVLGTVAVWWAREPPPAATPASIAVLPFADMSSNGDAEYLGEGIAEEIIHALSRIDGLHVAARTSAFAFERKNVDVREIGRALGVRAVLEGSVRRAGNRLRITVQLVDAQNGYHLWSEQYDRELGDVFAVQEQISRAVVRTLEPALLRNASAPLVSASTDNPAAFQLYMQGRYFWNQRTEESLRKAIQRFEQAIRIDPEYARAYSGLSDAHNALTDNGYVPAEPALTRAETAVRAALRLDPALAEAYTSLGHLQMHRWNWSGAEQSLRRSLELNPSYAPGYQWYAYLLAFHGRFDEALPLIRRAQNLDPLSPAIQSNYGEILFLARRFPEAVEQLRFALQMDSTRQGARTMLAASLTEMGRYDEAVAELQRVIATAGGWHRSAVSELGSVYVRAGRRAEAEQLRREIQRARREGKPLLPYHYAAFLGALGRRDEAFAQLGEALRAQASGLVTVAVSPGMDPLRSDPRFAAVLRQVRLPATANSRPAG